MKGTVVHKSNLLLIVDTITGDWLFPLLDVLASVVFMLTVSRVTHIGTSLPPRLVGVGFLISSIFQKILPFELGL